MWTHVDPNNFKSTWTRVDPVQCRNLVELDPFSKSAPFLAVAVATFATISLTNKIRIKKGLMKI